MKLDSLNFETLTQGILRVVYLETSLVANEAIALAVLYQSNKQLKLICIEAPIAFDALRALQGDAIVDNVIFSLQLLKQEFSKSNEDIDTVSLNISSFFLGHPQPFICEDAHSYARDYLYLASCLLEERKKTTSKKNMSQKDITDILFDKASQYDVITATRLFEGYNLELSKGNKIKFPIYGRNIIAAPVSMITQRINTAKNLAEAYCAKLSAARNQVKRNAILYIMTPSIDKLFNQSLLEDSLGELNYIANANDIHVRAEKSAKELAQAILHDEKHLI